MRKIMKTAMLFIALGAIVMPMAVMAEEAAESTISPEMFTVNNTLDDGCHFSGVCNAPWVCHGGNRPDPCKELGKHSV